MSALKRRTKKRLDLSDAFMNDDGTQLPTLFEIGTLGEAKREQFEDFAHTATRKIKRAANGPLKIAKSVLKRVQK